MTPPPGRPQALFVSYTSLLGGAERILLDRADALEGPVALACPEGELARRARGLGVHVVALRGRRMEIRGSARDRMGAPVRLAAQAREVRAAVAELGPRCVIAWNMRGLLVATGALAGLRPRRPLLFAHNELLPSALVGRVVRAAARRADRIAALSHAIAADLESDGRLSGRTGVIPPGVDLHRFSPSPPPDGPPEALLLGAIVGWKRPELALEAVALAARELPDLRLRVAGEPIDEAGGALLARLYRRAGAPDLAGRVEFAGQVDDVPAALSRATCLLHCADREPFGMALIEALACGRPVAAPRAAGPLEIVDQSCGSLYEPGDAEAAAAALVDVVRRAPELAAHARARAEERFDVRDSRARFRELIAELVAV